MKKIEWGFFLALAVSFALYDLVILFFSVDNPLLFNVNVNDGSRIDESFMYLAGLEKFTIFDPYLIEHNTDFTIRPLLPHFLFSVIYFICGKNINLAILIGHTIPPLVSALLIYKMSRLYSGRHISALVVVSAISSVFASITWAVHPNLHAGADLYLLQELTGFGNLVQPPVTAPTGFTRLYSPALTLPFFLLPLYFLLKDSKNTVLRGILISANLYAYPHQIIVLVVIELVFFVQRTSFSKLKESLHGYIPFLIGVGITAIPYGIQLGVMKASGNLGDYVARVGQTGGNAVVMAYAAFFCSLALLLFVASRFSFFKGTLHSQGQVSITPFAGAASLVYALALVSIMLLLIDSFLGFPQLHLFSLRIFVYIAPIIVVAFFYGLNSPFRISQSPYLSSIVIFICALLFAFIFLAYFRSAWVHRNQYSSFPDIFISDLNQLPNNKIVVMTDDGNEAAYISALTKKYSFIGNGIVSAASDLELVERYTILALIYEWPYNQLTESSPKLHKQLPVFHWIWHHGDKGPAARQEAFSPIFSRLSTLKKCDLLKKYQVDFIRYKNSIPDGLAECTIPASESFLRVTGRSISFVIDRAISPNFMTLDGWGGSPVLSSSGRDGIVVGPGPDNANVLSQRISVSPLEPLKIVARASSVKKPTATGRLQINWVGLNEQFISSSGKAIEVTKEERMFEYYVVAPIGAIAGYLYVSPHTPNDIVRFTEMRLLGADPKQ